MSEMHKDAAVLFFTVGSIALISLIVWGMYTAIVELGFPVAMIGLFVICLAGFLSMLAADTVLD